MRTIEETDWKYLAKLKPILLERLCNRILDQIQSVCRPEKRSADAHEQYLRVFKLVTDQDRIVADCFDGWSRSRAFERIAFLTRHKVLITEEQQGFSDETRSVVRLLAGL
jgi:hypothetical protein